jgi:chromosome partition protein MukE
MTDATFSDLGEVVTDDRFAPTDLALRSGRHIVREETDSYEFLAEAAAHLEPFYDRLGCNLMHQTDGYYYLLPTGDKLGRRHLSIAEMIVGQALALLYLDPSAVETGGRVTRDGLLSHLASVMGTDRLMGVFNPKKKRVDERVAQQTVRNKVAEALKKLAGLGFVELHEDQHIVLRCALLRFAESVRQEQSPAQALEQLLGRDASADTADAPQPHEGAQNDGDPDVNYDTFGTMFAEGEDPDDDDPDDDDPDDDDPDDDDPDDDDPDDDNPDDDEPQTESSS